MAVLLILVGLDFRRNVDGIRYWHQRIPIERIYLLFDKKKDTYGYASRRNAEDLSKVLSFAFEQPFKIGMNTRSYDDVFSTLYLIFKREANERDVYVDLTSASKEAYGATIAASLLFKRVHLYIVPPYVSEWNALKLGKPEFEEWFMKVRSVRGLEPMELHMPPVMAQEVNKDEEAVLLLLLSHGGRAPSIKKLIEWYGEDPSDPAVKNKFSRLIKRLINKGLITSRVGSRNKPISLSGFGLILAKVLKKQRYNIEREENTHEGIGLEVFADASFYLEEEPSLPP